MPSDRHYRIPSVTVTHKSGISVTVDRERSWHQSVKRALRILKARLYARNKGLATLDQSNLEQVKLVEVRKGQFAGEIKIEDSWYTITEETGNEDNQTGRAPRR